MSTKTYTDARTGNTYRITTNGRWRESLSWRELTKKEQAEFGYLDTLQCQQDASFLRVKGSVYDLGDVGRVDDMHGWHGAVGTNAFHAVLFKRSCEEDYWMTGEMYS